MKPGTKPCHPSEATRTMISFQNQTLKSALAADAITVGAWLTVPSPLLAEGLASCGFDWICVDFEHSPMDEAATAAAFIAIERHGSAPIVRLPSADPHLARRLLDNGAQGLIIADVNDPDAFRDFATFCLYPPQGRRGTGLSRANLWGDTFTDYRENFRPVLVPQIESRAGAEAAEAIAMLDEVDALFMGPYDLSADLGTPGDFTTEEFLAATASVRAACEAAGKPAGIHQVAPEPTELKARVDEGYRFLAYGTDIVAIRHTFADIGELER